VRWSGLSNYTQALSDSKLGTALVHVAAIGVVQIPIMLLVALVLALLLDRRRSVAPSAFRTAFFFPYSVPTVIAGLLWSFLYVPELSPFPSLLSHLGLTFPTFLSPKLVLWSVANIVTWEWTGYNVIIFTAALQAIPTQLYDAARVDGASEFQIARKIKLPLIAPALVMAGFFSIIGTLQMFNEPQILSGSASAITSFFTPNIYIYNMTFANQNPYYASSVAVILGVLTLILSFAALRATRRVSGL
jgi:multiple sugar transport system permease protein